MRPETIRDVLNRFPKKRPALPDDIKAIYETHYKKNREGRTTASFLAQRMEAWLHRMVASDLIMSPISCRTLEIGAGTLNQLSFEPDCGEYDIVEPFRKLFEGSALLSRINGIYPDIGLIEESRRYDRITSVAALEHVCNLPDVIARCGLLLSPQGALRVAIPSEGTLLWKLGWRLTTGLEFWFKYRADYSGLMQHEHVNTADEIEAVLMHFFSKVRCKVFGLTKRLSLYRYYECRLPDLEQCKQHDRIAHHHK